MANEIFAKPDETLIQHTENTLKVFKSIKDAYPEIPELCDVKDFWEHLFYSLFFHDFGKAATGFQKSLFEKGSPWGYRHEILSSSFISSLNGFYSDFYKYSIGLAIITHHKDVNFLREHNFSTKPIGNKPSPGFKVYIKKLEELKINFNQLIKYFDLIPEFSDKYLGYTVKTPKTIKFNELEDVFNLTVNKYYWDYDDEEYTQLHGIYGVFLKGLVNACDYLASGSKYEILNGIKDIGSLFDFKTLRKTQILASKTKGDTFLTAPTGSGKTEAALLWSGNNQNPLASKRVFYLLPYTASINAMYTRLKKDFKNPDLVANLHGKASYFLYKTFSDLDYRESKDKVKEIQNLSKKIYRPYKVLTPFQIIKSFFGVKGFEMNLSELANSLIILDEIHAYDAHVTSLLLEVLKILKKDYNVNFFIMSATIPSFLKKIFIKELNINQEILLNNNELDSFNRHELNIINSNIMDNLDLIEEDLNQGLHVLVVCNTVNKAQEIYKHFEDKGFTNSALLHSRFILKDRERIEGKLNDLNLLVGTQAIEVSLNINYDTLYSEPAPLDALIQRFGRVNRKGWEENLIKKVNVFSTPSENDKYIYNTKTVEKTLKVLENISLIKESEIQKIIDAVYGEGYTGDDLDEFLSVSENFKDFYQTIVPFINSKDSESSFYKLFNSYELVPQKFKYDFTEKFEKKEYYEMKSYFVSISQGQFMKQLNENNIEYDKTMNTYFIDIKYDSQLGLLLNEEEDQIL